MPPRVFVETVREAAREGKRGGRNLRQRLDLLAMSRARCSRRVDSFETTRRLEDLVFGRSAVTSRVDLPRIAIIFASRSNSVIQPRCAGMIQLSVMKSRRLTYFLFLSGSIFVWACSKSNSNGPAPIASSSSVAATLPAPSASAVNHAPPPKTKRRTTAGEIALTNLNGQIDSLDSLASQANFPPARRKSLIELLALRADVTGRIADLSRAAAMAENMPQEMKDSADGYLIRASMRSALHRFDDAWKDLDEAEKRGAKPVQTQHTRVSILAARGNTAEALVLATKARDEQRSIKTLGVLAALLGEAGRKEEAIATFQEAFDAFADTSPFPLAWLFFQQGQFWERDGNVELALAYYKAALERFPPHAHAAAHAARLSPAAEAEALLNPLLATSDDPELHTVLALQLQARGDAEAAKKHVDLAAKRYDELGAQHPAAFADHIAQFWLDAGNDPKKSFTWAKRNLEVRKTAKAYELAVIAALAMHDRKAACELGTEGAGNVKASAMFNEIVRGACEKK